uniref:Uncharacterized protein n=1 Tax=Plectus sambesii TaxID=2011161 RepID=A0A914XP70_9BILA
MNPISVLHDIEFVEIKKPKEQIIGYRVEDEEADYKVDDEKVEELEVMTDVGAVVVDAMYEISKRNGKKYKY